MSAGRLARGVDGRAAAPVRLVHLGLGSFFRAHQAWYIDRAPDGREWGVSAYAGRSAALADALTAQDGLYTLVTRAADGDRFDVLGSLSEAHPAADHASWVAQLASPDVRAVTLTVTEAAYLRGQDGGLDAERPEVRADIEALRRDPTGPAGTVPGRLLAGLAARRRADAGPLALVPCDNLPDNGAVVHRVLRELAERTDPELAQWLSESVSPVTTMVDRITPKTTGDDVRTVAAATGRDDQSPVVTEPFSEWVLSGDFPGGRPRWEDAGATIADDVTPFEQRKLWLLNGGHSLLAYAGAARGHETVADAVADDVCREWLAQWWAEAAAALSLPAADVAAYRDALLDRFTNPRIRHRLAQIAADGSQKLPIRALPVLRVERAAGRVPVGATRLLAAWVCHLRVGREGGVPVTDPRADELLTLAAGPLPEAARRVLAALDPAVADDDEVVAAVIEQARQVASSSAQ